MKLSAVKRPSHTSFDKRVALAWGGAVALALLGVALVRAGSSRPPRPVPPVEPGGSLLPPVASPDASRGACARTDVHLATHYLSTPKHEDVILTVETARLYALVLADGATSYRYNGGEYSGGGRHAAEIAAHTARTYLTRQLLPCLSMQDMLAHVQACFSAANTALEKHNASTPTPGATTLMIALLWHGGKGRWYWVYGTLGNGLLELLHAPPLLAGWPIHTPLMAKQTNGVTTITMPGYAIQGYRPAVACTPHTPGDLLVMGSDGLEHLETVTKTYDKLYFSNYLWKQFRHDRARVERALHGLHHERADTHWRNALELDDTTIGILWA